MPRRAAALLATLAGLAVAAGCSEPAVLDVEQTESSIRAQLIEAYDVEIASVVCDDEIPVEEDRVFRCDAQVGDETVGVLVRQSDAEGTLEVTSEQALLSTDAVETDIAAALADRFSRDDVVVTCDGPAERIEEPDATFTCEAIDGDESREVTVRVRDPRGALTYSLADD